MVTINKISQIDFAPIVPLIYIDGSRRTDFIVKTISFQTGTDPSVCELQYLPQTLSNGVDFIEPYDPVILQEDSMVVLQIPNYGVIFRGFVADTNNDPSQNGTSYICQGLIGKLNGCYFNMEFNYYDLATSKNLLNRTFVNHYTARQIAQIAYNSFLSFLGVTSYPLKFDYSSFPSNAYPQVKILGEGILDGLKKMLEEIDKRYSIRIIETNQGQILQAYIAGYTQTKSLYYHDDFNPITSTTAIVGKISSNKTTTDVISSITAEGSNLIKETIWELTPRWTEFVTAEEELKVVDNYEKYTTEKFKVDSDNEELNPNFKPAYTYVGKFYSIPKIDDVWYFDEDPNTLYGKKNTYVEIQSDTLQYINGEPVKRFLVCKKPNDETLYIQWSGFSVENNDLVVMGQPLFYEINHVVGFGNDGTTLSYDNSTKLSVYKSTTAELNREVEAGESLYLFLGDYGNVYPISSHTITDTEITLNVQGNLTGCNEEAGNNYFIIETNNIVLSGTGTGAAHGVFTYNNSGSEDITNDYKGYYFVPVTLTDNIITSFPAEYKYKKIIRSSNKCLYLGDETDLTDTYDPNQQFIIVNPNFIEKELYEKVWLNAAYKSLRKLSYFSPNLSDVKTKRAIYKQNTEYKWDKKENYFALTPIEGYEGYYTPVFVAGAEDVINDYYSLRDWALGQVYGQTFPKSSYNLELPYMDLGYQCGDTLLVNGDYKGSVKTINMDFEKQIVTMTTENR